MARIEGMGRLNKKLQRLAREIPKKVPDALEDAAEPALKEARARAPKRTRTLEKDLEIIRTGKVVAIHTPEAFWGWFAEMGRQGQPAKPWLLPAFHNNKRNAIRAFADKLRREIRARARSTN